MPKQKAKSSRISMDPMTYQELLMIRFDIKATRRVVNESLDAILDRINSLLPKEETPRSRRLKTYTKKDWERFLKF